MKAGKIILVIVGSVVALLGLALMAGGGAALWAKLAVEDEDGYISTGFEPFRSPTYAISSQDLDVVDLPAGTGHYARVRIRAAPGVSGKRLFVGIGPSDLVQGYLANVAHDEVRDIDIDPFEAHYDRIPGTAQPRPPRLEGFWVASAAGPGVQTVVWPLESGRWAAVVMNADASRGVAAEVDLGAKLSFLLWVAIGLLIGGAFVVGGSAALAVLAVRRPAPAPGPPTAVIGPDATTTPEPPARPPEEPPDA